MAKTILVNKSSEDINSKGSDFAQQLTNLGNKLQVDYKGKTFRNSEHAYQTWKSGEFDEKAYKSKAAKPKGSKEAAFTSNYETMVDIITAKLKQHPDLVKGIDERGGLDYINNSTHTTKAKDSYWESEGENKFIEALAEAYTNAKTIVPTKEVKKVMHTSYNNNGLTIIENAISDVVANIIAPMLKAQIEYQSYRQTGGSSSFDFGLRWTRLDDKLSPKIKRSFIIGKQLNGLDVTKEKLEKWAKGEKVKSLKLPTYGYSSLDQFGNPLPPIPKEIIIEASNKTGIDLSTYQASYNSIYAKMDDGRLVIHQDNTEQITAPIVTMSFGLPMEFITYELKNSDDYNLAGNYKNMAYASRVYLITKKIEEYLPNDPIINYGKVTYGAITPNNIVEYAIKIDKAMARKKEKSVDYEGMITEVLDKVFTQSTIKQHIIKDKTILVFEGDNRNVMHEVVYNKELSEETMPAYLPTIKVNKKLLYDRQGNKNKPNYESTDAYRAVLTLRKVTNDGRKVTKFNNETHEMIFNETNQAFEVVEKKQDSIQDTIVTTTTEVKNKIEGIAVENLKEMANLKKLQAWEIPARIEDSYSDHISESFGMLVLDALEKNMGNLKETPTEIGTTITIGQYVEYKKEPYIIVKQNNNNTVQIYNPNKQGVASKKSVSPKNLKLLSFKAPIVYYPKNKLNYIVTDTNKVISIDVKKIQEVWENDNDNGDKRAILQIAKEDNNLVDIDTQLQEFYDINILEGTVLKHMRWDAETFLDKFFNSDLYKKSDGNLTFKEYANFLLNTHSIKGQASTLHQELIDRGEDCP
jgi:hypothetical protein